MEALDPKWISVELEAIQIDEQRWDRSLRESSEIAFQRVLEYQARSDKECDTQD